MRSCRSAGLSDRRTPVVARGEQQRPQRGGVAAVMRASRSTEYAADLRAQNKRPKREASAYGDCSVAVTVTGASKLESGHFPNGTRAGVP
jgi:hypothetical protein